MNESRTVSGGAFRAGASLTGDEDSAVRDSHEAVARLGPVKSASLAPLLALAAACSSAPEPPGSDGPPADLGVAPRGPVVPWRHELVLDEGHGRVVLAEGLVSDVIEPAAPFNELLPSWNVDVPDGAGFRVELRVGRGAEWSPWLYAGDWGVTPPAEPLVAFDRGRVDVDWFRSDELWERAQYRLTGAGDPLPRLARFALCFSDRTDGGTPPEPVWGPRLSEAGWQRRLEVPFRAQGAEGPELGPRICSPTSVSMLLAYRGVECPTAEVAARAYDRAHDIYGNWPRAVQAAYSYGVPGYVTRFADWYEVRRMIVQGQPLVVSIRAKEGELANAPYPSTNGHLLVLTGFDERGDVLVNDPAASGAEQGVAVYSREEMERVWMGNGGTAYVLEPRR